MTLSSVPVTLVRDSGHGCVDVAIIPDDMLEETENFTVSLDSSATNTTLSVTISIMDTSEEPLYLLLLLSQLFVCVCTAVCMTGELRLVDGATNATGRLEVCYHGEWGSVCDDLFNDRAAMVACRQLGFDSKSCMCITCVHEHNM